jgi:hypothetical protein
MTASFPLPGARDDEGLEGGLADAPAGFVAAEPDPAEAAVPEPTPDRLGVEAEAFSSLRDGEEMVGVRHGDSFLLLRPCSRKVHEMTVTTVALGLDGIRRLAFHHVPSSYRLERVTPTSQGGPRILLHGDP